MKQYRFMDPEVIMSVVVALIILAVGIFAFMVTVTSIPTETPVSVRASATSANTSIVDVNTSTHITVLSTYRNTSTTYNLITLEAYGKYGGAVGWWTVQTAGNANGTFLGSNNTYVVDAGTVHGGAGAATNISFRLNYYTNGSATSTLQNRTFYSIMNASETGDSVFNIIGIVLIIGAIMTIIGLVYSYMRPRY